LLRFGVASLRGCFASGLLRFGVAPLRRGSASGLPTPRRRTLAAGIPALRSLGIGRRSAILAPLANDAGSRGVGNPSLVKRRGDSMRCDAAS